LCVAEIPQAERIDCYPGPGATVTACLARGCFWCEATPDGEAPWCFRPLEQGYRIVGDVVDTAKGYSATLERVNTPSWYGSNIQTVLLEVEFHTEDRLRIKVTQ
jgi:peptide methionine sulfoxide reductase MsrA